VVVASKLNAELFDLDSLYGQIKNPALVEARIGAG
jgi:hypothetical protein